MDNTVKTISLKNENFGLLFRNEKIICKNVTCDLFYNHGQLEKNKFPVFVDESHSVLAI